MSNKAHLRPHRKKRQASRTTGLLLLIFFAALVALATAMVASGHALPAGRIIPLRTRCRTRAPTRRSVSRHRQQAEGHRGQDHGHTDEPPPAHPHCDAAGGDHHGYLEAGREAR